MARLLLLKLLQLVIGHHLIGLRLITEEVLTLVVAAHEVWVSLVRVFDFTKCLRTSIVLVLLRFV